MLSKPSSVLLRCGILNFFPFILSITTEFVSASKFKCVYKNPLENQSDTKGYQHPQFLDITAHMPLHYDVVTLVGF